ncbi:MAG: hypothetical protein SPF07_01850 [Eubacteriales bacterium]|nr:hypothetical protein [Eubacteriales bacterium]
MASYKRIVLTEHDSAPTATINSDVKKQLNRFDTTYTSKKLNELYNEFDAMAVNNETVNSTIVKTNAVDTVDVYAKAKVIIYLTTTIIVTALLAFLAIYNIFVINGLNSNINLLQEDVETAQQQYDNLRKNFGDLSEAELRALINEAFNGEYGDIESNGSNSVGMLDTNNGSAEQVSTNWFDQLCTFLSNLFGG